MEIYVADTLSEANNLNDRILTALKNDSILGSGETKWSRVLESLDSKFGLIIKPNDSETGNNYRDSIISELTTEEESKIIMVDRDNINWFPNVKSENDTKLSL